MVGRSSAESVAYFMLSLIPTRFVAAVVSASGSDLPLCVGAVIGGAMFGDNLLFISDTTIAACNGQGCAMKDKFRENFRIASPAAAATLVIILLLSFRTDLSGAVSQPYNLIQIIPYILVLTGGIIGINVFVVLLVGIVSGTVIILAMGQITLLELISNMGSGAAADQFLHFYLFVIFFKYMACVFYNPTY